jgi:beta-N-acetylglucosaminidase
VYENIQNSIAYLYDSSVQAVILKNGQEVSVTQALSINGSPFYRVEFAYNGIWLSGYVAAEYVFINSSISVVTTPTPTPPPGNTNPSDYNFEAELQKFPESYRNSLRQLHATYPNWIFVPCNTGLDWNTVIQEESIPGKNTIPNTKSYEWLSFEEGAYSWKTDKFTIRDGTYWVTASKAAIEYYMDPRNFLTANTIFQFELLKYQSDYQNLSGVENVLKGTALHNASYSFIDDYGVAQAYTYAETFIKAAIYSGVSPYHLASRVKQEVVTGSTTLSNSVSGTYSYKGEDFTGYYNFYNIGANDSAGGGAIANGLRYAKNGTSSATNNSLYLIPWTSPYKSIVGGGYFLGSSYINRGQDTVYLQKFNVTSQSTYFHQYMTNVEAPWAEGRKIFTAYGDMADSQIVFSIPVYLNMPVNPAPVPAKMLNPNNWLKSLKVYDMQGHEHKITPTFSPSQHNYTMIVENGIDIVEIEAAAVSTKATVTGNGHVTLNVGMNEIVVPVIAQNGDILNYIISIVRE